jgi:hypothetical protein
MLKYDIHLDASFEAFKAVMFKAEVFRKVTPCSALVGYQRFRSPLQGVTTQETSI